ncbi:MAG: GGDEF domain-containing phosphodiesterase [Ruminiclostridium sp.]|nr:GGDEF domain-containing phosphodiesterase [Ruminiclostridium sp.]
MLLTEDLADKIRDLICKAVKRTLLNEDYRPLCDAMNAARMYYDIDLVGEGRYRDHQTQKLAIPGMEKDGCIVLYESGKPSGDTLIFTYYYEGELEYAHAYLELIEGVSKDSIDKSLYNLLSDIIYLLVSRDNMRYMLTYAETRDTQTGIPNSVYISSKFDKITKETPGENYAVICVNLRNFKYINEIGGSEAGDEAIVLYANTIVTFVHEDECVARLGGDNFVIFVRKERLTDIIERLRTVKLQKLLKAPGRSFELSSWIGVSAPLVSDRRPFGVRLNEAAIACGLGKTRLKHNVVFFSEELKIMMNRGREIMAMFYPAVKKHEFHPFFQPKVDMRTGKLVGFEALCRWIHDGRFIFPDQFIPILDKEGLIHELDMLIFRETCLAIRKWKEMGLNPPRISSNFSRKNLFVPDIETKILETISDCDIDVSDVEIEITESVQEAETARLIEFVSNLKNSGLHISIDDFGTGYSSLMLIHNIDADVIKIDKSFVDEINVMRKSKVLIESIIGIASNLGMQPVAEGVETAEQGRSLMELGCFVAQGYYYSKPVGFDAATGFIKRDGFEPIAAE